MRNRPFGVALGLLAILSAGCTAQQAGGPTSGSLSSSAARASVSAPTTITPSGLPALAAVHMATESAGWAFAQRNLNGLGTLVRTSDGGSHWVTVPLPSSLNTPDIEAADFHDEARAWLLIMVGAESTASHQTAVVASTSDSGIHWAATPKFQIDGAATAVQFVDDLTGWVFATPSAGGAMGAGDTTLYRTVDGGQHWQPIKPPSEVRQTGVVAGLPEACPMGGPVGRPTFTDDATGWMGAFCSRPFFYATHDGGLSWKPVALPPFPGPAGGSVASLSFNVDSFQRQSINTFSVVVHRGVTTGGNALQDAALYRTDDAGSSWRAIRLPAAELVDEFTSANDGWMIAAGAGGNTEARSLYRTADGGRTWLFVDGPAGYYASGLNFVDLTTGFLAVSATQDSAPEFLRTSDGGKSWAGVPTTIS